MGLQADLVKHISEKRVEAQRETCGGTYLPLSVYQTQGYNTDNIKANSVSRYDDELKETTYKLKVLSEYDFDLTLIIPYED